MNKTPMTLDRAIELAREVVARRGPDFRYLEPAQAGFVSCMYVPNDDPRAPIPSGGRPDTGCLVGEILNADGRMTEDIASGMASVRTIATAGHVALRPPARDFLARLQARQDSGWTWGKALDNALENVDR